MAKRKKKPAALSPAKVVVDRSLILRSQRVLLDADLAVLYGVETRQLNQQVRRNAGRFPADFAFQLTPQEWADLKSQSVISSFPEHGGRRTRPWAFTEQGVAMLSSVLNSPTAVAVNIQIVRAFVRLRQLLATPGDLADQLRRIMGKVDRHDRELAAIFELLDQLIEQPAPNRRRIGFGRS